MRDIRVDFLRFVGLAMIILAHVHPPGWLFQLRNFDVPLMVLISGMSFGMSYRPSEHYASYVWKRIKRLLFPVWKFLTLYFVALLILSPAHQDLGLHTIWTSYALIDGIGYVWIIRVFLLVALAAPLIFFLNKRIESDSHYLMWLLAGFSAWEMFRYLSMPLIQGGIGEFFSLIVHYVVPYSMVFALGLRLARLSFNHVCVLLLVAVTVLFGFGGWLFVDMGNWVPTQQFKYPPSVYYLSYALAVSGGLWLMSPYLLTVIERLKLKQGMLFVAQNSIWIYLWHIPFVKGIQQPFYLKYLLVFGAAVVIAYCQVWLVNNVLLERVSGENSRRNIRMLLTG